MWYPFFSKGTFVDLNNRLWSYGDKEINEIVETYNPNKHLAPLLVNHNAGESNKAVVEAVKRVGDWVYAKFSNWDESFKKDVDDLRWPALSGGLWHPEDPGNPSPGKWSLMEISACQIPAVSGQYGAPRFSAPVLFNQGEKMELFLDEKGVGIEEVKSTALFSATKPKEKEEVKEQEDDDDSPPTKKRRPVRKSAKFSQEIDTKEIQVLQRQVQELKEENMRTSFSQFAKSAIGAGKLPPGVEELAVETLVAASAISDRKVRFSQGEDLSLANAIMKLINSITPAINFSQIAPPSVDQDQQDYASLLGMKGATLTSAEDAKLAIKLREKVKQGMSAEAALRELGKLA